MDIESIAMTLRAMLSQEEAYSFGKFIQEKDHDDAQWLARRTALYDGDDLALNSAFRSRLVRWAYQVTDFFKFQRETVEFATSYFDRFLQTSHAAHALRDRWTFHLAFITCLCLATKLHEQATIAPASLSRLTKGVYSTPDVVKMEATILSALQWRLNPPTSLGFVRYFIALHPLTQFIAPSCRDTIYDLAKVQIELMVDDDRFIAVPRSTVALAALTNALESLQADPDGVGMAYLVAMTKNVGNLTPVRTELYKMASKLPHLVNFPPNELTYSLCRGLDISAPHSPRSVHLNPLDKG